MTPRLHERLQRIFARVGVRDICADRCKLTAADLSADPGSKPRCGSARAHAQRAAHSCSQSGGAATRHLAGACRPAAQLRSTRRVRRGTASRGRRSSDGTPKSRAAVRATNSIATSRALRRQSTNRRCSSRSSNPAMPCCRIPSSSSRMRASSIGQSTAAIEIPS